MKPFMSGQHILFKDFAFKMCYAKVMAMNGNQLYGPWTEIDTGIEHKREYLNSLFFEIIARYDTEEEIRDLHPEIFI